MNYYLKSKLKDRLDYCIEWKRNAENYIFHRGITEAVDQEYYKQRPVLKFFLTIYFVPTNLLEFIKYLKFIQNIEKNEIEIEFLTTQLDEKKLEKK